jgi:iodotyrosine deiodinase
MGFLSQVLERPVNERPFLLLPAGFPAQDAEVPGISKKPLAESVVFIE